MTLLRELEQSEQYHSPVEPELMTGLFPSPCDLELFKHGRRHQRKSWLQELHSHFNLSAQVLKQEKIDQRDQDRLKYILRMGNVSETDLSDKKKKQLELKVSSVLMREKYNTLTYRTTFMQEINKRKN